MAQGTNEEVITDILRATDYYEVLGGTRDMDTAALRRCYLKRSVAVHPDKNPHELATAAFQKLAEAWSVLSDETKRRDYDISPDRTSDWYHNMESDTGFTAEEAFVAFAQAYNSAARSGSLGGGFAETIFWAQQLVERRKAGQPMDANMLLRGGFALSSSMREIVKRTLGSTADALGFKGFAKTTQNAPSVAQTASNAAAIGAVAYQNPEVRNRIESGKAAMNERLRNIGTAVENTKENFRRKAKEVSEDLNRMKPAEQISSTIANFSSWLKKSDTAVVEETGKGAKDSTEEKLDNA